MIFNLLTSFLLIGPWFGYVSAVDVQSRDILARIENENRKIVVAFYEAFAMDHDISSIEKYISDDTYIQHDPGVGDGALALEAGGKEWFPPGTPSDRDKKTIVRTIADGDLVYLHVREKMRDGNWKAQIDMFRVQCGKLVEHWDVRQKFPPANETVSPHPFF